MPSLVLPALFLNVFFLVPFFVASSSTPVLCGLPVAEFRPWPCLPVAEFRVWPCLPVAEFRPLALPARCRVQALALPAQPGFAERSCQAAHSLLPSGSAHGACTQNLVGVPCEDSGWCLLLLSRGMERLLASPCDAGSCHWSPIHPGVQSGCSNCVAVSIPELKYSDKERVLVTLICVCNIGTVRGGAGPSQPVFRVRSWDPAVP